MAMLCVLPAALGRLAIHVVADDREPITQLIVFAGCAALAFVLDTVRHRPVHPVFG